MVMICYYWWWLVKLLMTNMVDLWINFYYEQRQTSRQMNEQTTVVVKLLSQLSEKDVDIFIHIHIFNASCCYWKRNSKNHPLLLKLRDAFKTRLKKTLLTLELLHDWKRFIGKEKFLSGGGGGKKKRAKYP